MLEEEMLFIFRHSDFDALCWETTRSPHTPLSHEGAWSEIAEVRRKIAEVVRCSVMVCGDAQWFLPYLIITVLAFVATSSAQAIPKELWGRWIVRRELPATTISCWGEPEARKLIGTELEYSAELFRWKDVLTKHPSAETKVVSSEQFHADNSGMGTNSSQVTFAQLGIRRKQATAVTIQHPEASLGGATTEIPGDNILVKGRDTIVFSVCNVYFEAKRVTPDPRHKPAH